MTGKYDIEIYNKRVHYHLTVKRNITVIQGDSATGKTELLRMISDYENNGISSGITKICEKTMCSNRKRFMERKTCHTAAMHYIY